MSSKINSNLIELRVMNPKPETQPAQTTEAKVSAAKKAISKQAPKATSSTSIFDAYASSNFRTGPM